MIPDRLHYFLDDVWSDKKSIKSGPSDPVSITKIFQKIHENMGKSFNILFFMAEHLKVWNCRKVCVPNFLSCWNSIFGNMEVGNLETWKWEMWTFKKGRVGNWKWELDIESLKTENLDIWTFESLRIGNWNFATQPHSLREIS